jgi:hypothetical protein
MGLLLAVPSQSDAARGPLTASSGWRKAVGHSQRKRRWRGASCCRATQSDHGRCPLRLSVLAKLTLEQDIAAHVTDVRGGIVTGGGGLQVGAASYRGSKPGVGGNDTMGPRSRLTMNCKLGYAGVRHGRHGGGWMLVGEQSVRTGGHMTTAHEGQEPCRYMDVRGTSRRLLSFIQNTETVNLGTPCCKPLANKGSVSGLL